MEYFCCLDLEGLALALVLALEVVGLPSSWRRSTRSSSSSDRAVNVIMMDDGLDWTGLDWTGLDWNGINLL